MSEFTELAGREAITQQHITMIVRQLGVGAIIMGQIEPKYGAGITKAGEKCVWNKRRHRITLSFRAEAFIASCSKEPDPACQVFKP